MNKEQKTQLEQEVAFANQGKLVLSNKAYQQALTLRKAQIFEVFCKTKYKQSEEREEAWRTMQNMIALEDYFRILLDTGKMAEITLENNKSTEKTL